MSPDEVALVQAAHEVGVSFSSRIRKHAGSTSEVVVTGPQQAERKFTVLHELAFTSDRKRMSVVVRHKGAIWCITKGADSVMEGLLVAPFNESCARDLAKFSKQGLRTLIVGMRVVEQTEFDEWSAAYSAARNTIDETREEQMAEVRQMGFPLFKVPLFSAHQMGTCRMGSDPATSVVKPTCESWECEGLYVVDASVFPTSSGANPMVTTLAIAHMAAQGLKRAERVAASCPPGFEPPVVGPAHRVGGAVAAAVPACLSGVAHMLGGMLKVVLGRSLEPASDRKCR